MVGTQWIIRRILTPRFLRLKIISLTLLPTGAIFPLHLHQEEIPPWTESKSHEKKKVTLGIKSFSSEKSLLKCSPFLTLLLNFSILHLLLLCSFTDLRLMSSVLKNMQYNIEKMINTLQRIVVKYKVLCFCFFLLLLWRIFCVWVWRFS